MNHDWNAIKQVVFALGIMSAFVINFAAGVVVGHAMLIDHPSSTKVAMYLSW